MNAFQVVLQRCSVAKFRSAQMTQERFDLFMNTSDVFSEAVRSIRSVFAVIAPEANPDIFYLVMNPPYVISQLVFPDVRRTAEEAMKILHFFVNRCNVPLQLDFSAGGVAAELACEISYLVVNCLYMVL